MKLTIHISFLLSLHKIISFILHLSWKVNTKVKTLNARIQLHNTIIFLIFRNEYYKNQLIKVLEGFFFEQKRLRILSIINKIVTQSILKSINHFI